MSIEEDLERNGYKLAGTYNRPPDSLIVSPAVALKIEPDYKQKHEDLLTKYHKLMDSYVKLANMYMEKVDGDEITI